MRSIIFTFAALASSGQLLAQSTSLGPGDQFVFSTNSEWSDKQIAYDDKTYKPKVTKTCKDESKAPGECYWIVTFMKPALLAWEMEEPAEDMPKMRCASEPYSFTVEDINKDGTKEIIVLCGSHGDWRTVRVFAWGDPSQTSGPFWYEPIGSFEWWAGSGGDRVCDAQLFWRASKNAVRVLTNDVSEEDFKCTKQEVMPWVMK